MTICPRKDRWKMPGNDMQELIIYDSNQSILGYVSENGFVYDSHRTLLGYVSYQGIIRDDHLQGVGQIDLVEHSFPLVAGKVAFLLLIERKGRNT